MSDIKMKGEGLMRSHATPSGYVEARRVDLKHDESKRLRKLFKDFKFAEAAYNREAMALGAKYAEQSPDVECYVCFNHRIERETHLVDQAVVYERRRVQLVV